MIGKELMKICEQYPDFEFVFAFVDGFSTTDNGTFMNIRRFSNLNFDVGHSDKVVSLSGEEN